MERGAESLALPSVNVASTDCGDWHGGHDFLIDISPTTGKSKEALILRLKKKVFMKSGAEPFHIIFTQFPGDRAIRTLLSMSVTR